MKKKYKILIIILILLILLIPIKRELKDGGTIEYCAIMYKVTDYHAISGDREYVEGLDIEILGITIYHNTYIIQY